MEEVDFVLSVIQKSELNWSKVTQEDVKMTRLVSNSNHVFLIETSLLVFPKRFIYRMFGSGETLDLDANSLVFHRLSQSKLAPKIYSETSDYRLEEYLEGTRNISRSECLQPTMAKAIGKALKEFHAQDLSDIIDPHSPICVKNALKWRGLGMNVLSKIAYSKRQNEIDLALSCLDTEYYNMFIDILPKESPIVMSHMDTSFLNFLYKEEKEQILIIDYDYSGYCYRGFDIAMLLQDIKYDYNYPDYPFYRYCPEMVPTDEILAEYIKAYGGNCEMFLECKKCMIAAHYLWAVWAFSLYEENENAMDMLGYGLLRFSEFVEGYRELKDANLDTIRKSALNYFNE